MTGKDFFGRLLTKREVESPPWDRSEPTTSPPDEPAERDAAAGGRHAMETEREEAADQHGKYVDAPVADLSSRDRQEQESPSLEMRFDPSQLRSAEFDGPGGDGLSSDLPTMRPGGPQEVEDPSEYGDPASAPPANDSRDEFASSPEWNTDARPSNDWQDDAPPSSDSRDDIPPPTDVPPLTEWEHDAPPVNDWQDDTPPSDGWEAEDPYGTDQAAATEDLDRAARVEPGADVDAAEAPAEEAQPAAEAPHADARQTAEAPPADTQQTDPVVEDDLVEPVDQVAPHDAVDTSKEEDERLGPPIAGETDPELGEIRDRVVIRLMYKEIVKRDQVKKAIRARTMADPGVTLWRILAQDPTVDRERVYREAALTYAFVERDLDENEIKLEFVRKVADVFPEKKRNRLIELRILPIGYEVEQQTHMLRVVFITHDPSHPAVRELMQDLNLERYELQYASESQVKELLAKAFPKKNEYLERISDDSAYDLGASYEDDKSELIDEDALEAEINRSSLINLFEGALVEAVHRGASDIHIYPNPNRQIEIHFRVDGRLAHWHTEDKVHPESMLAVIKDNTMNVDRFERDMAQDGFIQRKVDDALIRFRVSILPIATASNNLHAESIVIRVLDDRKVITDLSKLGLLEGALERFDTAIRQPHGMVILTGPTGSGKSTTLVAALHQVITSEVNVLTVEDPVEYIIPGVRQIKLNHKLGLEGALRAILRHDPDIVMVGEMRDRDTAELAVKLANTGHLTFSTLHTNDAPSAVSRLYKMGVEPFLIAYAINLVVAQRLLRNLCPQCKVVDDDPDPVLLKKLGFTEQDIAEHVIYRESGDSRCPTCKGQGYKGRRAISEALYFTREIRHTIVEADMKIDEDGLRRLARSQGMLTLQDSAREVVKMGETSVHEMMRVTASEE